MHGVEPRRARRRTAPTSPAPGCSKLLISAGVVRIVYADAYPDPVGRALLAEAGVALEQFGPTSLVRALT